MFHYLGSEGWEEWFCRCLPATRYGCLMPKKSAGPTPTGLRQILAPAARFDIIRSFERSLSCQYLILLDHMVLCEVHEITFESSIRPLGLRDYPQTRSQPKLLKSITMSDHSTICRNPVIEGPYLRMLPN